MNRIICPNCGIEIDKENSCEKCNSNTLLKEKYYLLKILGKNIGITYLAEDLDKKHFIIKELSLKNVTNWKTNDYFQKEGKILSQLNHKAIPRFIEEFNIGIGKNENHYLVMEHIEGISLREEFERKRYTEEEVISIIIEIAEILKYLHSLMPPVIHRDIKLSNLMRNKDGKIVLIDFGSVKDIVKNSTLSGTFGFMAPEQFKGESRIENDFYSLGVVALVLLSRKEPEDMMDDGISLKWKEHVFIKNNLKYILSQLLEVDPNKRLNDVDSLIDQLKNREKLKIKKQKSNEIIVSDDEKENKIISNNYHSKYSDQFIELYERMDDEHLSMKDNNDYISWQNSAGAFLGFGMIGTFIAVWYYYDFWYSLGATAAYIFTFMFLTAPFYKKKAAKFIDEFFKKLDDVYNKEMLIAVLDSWVRNNEFDSEFLEVFEKKKALLKSKYKIRNIELKNFQQEVKKDSNLRELISAKLIERNKD